MDVRLVLDLVLGGIVMYEPGRLAQEIKDELNLVADLVLAREPVVDSPDGGKMLSDSSRAIDTLEKWRRKELKPFYYYPSAFLRLLGTERFNNLIGTICWSL